MKEITIDVRAKIMALYLGCDVEYPDTNNKLTIARLTSVGLSDIETTYKRKKKGCIGDILSFKSNGNHNSNALNARLSLFSLSDIPDEDIITAARLLQPDDIGAMTDDKIIPYLDDVRNLFHKPFTDPSYKVAENDISPIFVAASFDYLRSKGYALPYLHWSVDDLVQHGIFKLKTTNP